MPPRGAYFGTDQPEARFIPTQASPAQAPYEGAESSIAAEINAMIARGGGTLRLPAPDVLGKMAPEELQSLFSQIEKYAATDGEFQAMAELAMELGIDNPYPETDPAQDPAIDPVAEDTAHMFDQATVERLGRQGGAGDFMLRQGMRADQGSDAGAGSANALAQRALGQATSQDEASAARRFERYRMGDPGNENQGLAPTFPSTGPTVGKRGTSTMNELKRTPEPKVQPRFLYPRSGEEDLKYLPSK